MRQRLAGGRLDGNVAGHCITGSGSIADNVNVTGLGSIVQSSTGSITGNVNVGNGGTLATTSTAATILGSLTYTSSVSSTYGGLIGGNASAVTLNSPGAMLTLSGSNQYGGGTFIQGGTLKLGNPSTLGVGGLSMTAGTFDMNGSNATLPSLAGTGTVLNSGTANHSDDKCSKLERPAAT